MARPAKWKNIDKEQLEKCAERQWTIEEIAAFFRVSKQTINRRFGPVIDECRERGRSKIRDLQWRKALEGSDKMIIHISKHYLKQHDREHIEHSGTTTQITKGTVLILPEKDIHNEPE